MKTKTISKNLGGQRIGSGNKNNINLHAYNRSTHDLSRAWRSSMMPGLLVPCFVDVFLPGDTWSIDINALVKTQPTIRPLYGDYKLQIDTYFVPMRLYNGLLHNNMVNIGLDMSNIKLPKMQLTTKHYRHQRGQVWIPTNEQIATDALISYLGIRGLGGCQFSGNDTSRTVQRDFNAVPILGYWDIVKNYYANKQEKKLYYIGPDTGYTADINKIEWIPNPASSTDVWTGGSTVTPPLPADLDIPRAQYETLSTPIYIWHDTVRVRIQCTHYIDPKYIWFSFLPTGGSYPQDIIKISMADLFCRNESIGVEPIPGGYREIIRTKPEYEWNEEELTWYCKYSRIQGEILQYYWSSEDAARNNIIIKNCPIENIDQARIDILQNTGIGNQFYLNQMGYAPYADIVAQDNQNTTFNWYKCNGLALKTYQSDLLNNWLRTEWLDGPNGINTITAIDTSSGSFSIDAFNLAKKVYNMLNRIAVSGGSYEDYIEAVYSIDVVRRAESPIYIGGAAYEICFDEVVNTAATETAPLGQLAGKGFATAQRGGKIEYSDDEPGFIIGIASITPRIDYSQGNKWFMSELDTVYDLHKPELDGIGFEDLLYERASWLGTWLDINGIWQKGSFGKVPAYINYMTALNETYGDFAELNNNMAMTLNRRYEADGDDGILDPTTYVNPTKYNYSFADARLSAQNFWVQIAYKCEVRRVMSAKTIPIV